MTDGRRLRPRPGGSVFLIAVLAAIGGLWTWTLCHMLFGDFSWPSFGRAALVFALAAISVLLLVTRRRRYSHQK